MSKHDEHPLPVEELIEQLDLAVQGLEAAIEEVRARALALREMTSYAHRQRYDHG